jgi:hypothetical protein
VSTNPVGHDILVLGFYTETAVGPILNGLESEQKKKMGPTAVSETSSTNLPFTPCKTPKPKYQYSSDGESLKSRSVGHVLF